MDEDQCISASYPDAWTAMYFEPPDEKCVYVVPLRRGQVRDTQWSAWLTPTRPRRKPGEVPYSRPGEWEDAQERKRYYNWHVMRWWEERRRRRKKPTNVSPGRLEKSRKSLARPAGREETRHGFPQSSVTKQFSTLPL